jgi:dCTP deaminase
MPLSDVEIWAELSAGRLVIDPTPEATRISGSSIDLVLFEDLLILDDASETTGISVFPAETNVTELLNRYSKKVTCSESNPYKLNPNKMVIGKTNEVVGLPPHLSARIEGKSSLARLGLGVHITAPTVIAGFHGRLVLEMINHGPFVLELKPLMPIAQLIVEHLGLPARGGGYQGQYQHQM